MLGEGDRRAQRGGGGVGAALISRQAAKPPSREGQLTRPACPSNSSQQDKLKPNHSKEPIVRKRQPVLLDISVPPIHRFTIFRLPRRLPRFLHRRNQTLLTRLRKIDPQRLGFRDIVSIERDIGGPVGGSGNVHAQSLCALRGGGKGTGFHIESFPAVSHWRVI